MIRLAGYTSRFDQNTPLSLRSNKDYLVGGIPKVQRSSGTGFNSVERVVYPNRNSK